MEKKLSVHLDKSSEERLSDTLNVQVNNDDTHFAVGCADGQVRLYTLSTCHLVRTLNCRVNTETPAVTSVRWRPSRGGTQNVLIATTGDGSVSHWHATSGKLMDRFQLPYTQVLSSDITVSGLKFALGCSDNSVKVFDENSRTHLLSFEPGRGSRLGHSNRIFSVKWLDDNLILSGGWDSNVILWDTRSGRPAGGFFGPLVAGESIDFDAGLVYVGSYEGKDQLQVWDLRSFESVEKICIGNGKAYCLRFSNDLDRKILAVGNTGEFPVVAFWKNGLNRADAVFGDSAVYCLDFCKGKDKFVTVNTEHLISIFDFNES
jgi:WD40 repeat protein